MIWLIAFKDLRERLHDLDDLAHRLIRELMGRQHGGGASSLPQDAIIVRWITATETLTLSCSGCQQPRHGREAFCARGGKQLVVNRPEALRHEREG